MEKAEKARLESWRVQSPETPGFHKVITPETSDSKVVRAYRLNLKAGQSHTLETGTLEMNPVLMRGKASLDHPALPKILERFDSFYLPAKQRATITAVTDSVFYIGAAPCDGIGLPAFRKFDSTLPLGGLHQIHGAGAGQREVFFSVDPEMKASRLISGLTWGGVGTWTSWPPHQHEKDLEEIYCYFDKDAPHFGFHLSYLPSGGIADAVVHSVHDGTMVQAPAGYHPTAASPTGQNAYYWVLGAFKPESRRYDLAVPDPALEK